jgi:hypothetical protein
LTVETLNISSFPDKQEKFTLPLSFLFYDSLSLTGVHDGNRNPNPTKESDYPDLMQYNIAYI